MSGKRYALCIGISEYQDPSLNLECARNDAEKVGEVLEDKMRGDFEVQTLFDTEATKTAILKAFNNLLQNPNLQSDSLILVYFAGHSNLDKSKNLYLMPYDGACHPEDQSANIGTMVTIKELEPSLDNTKAQTVVLIFDSCRSGAAGKLLGRIRYDNISNIIVVGAARSSETAKEYRQGRHGRFTYYFLQALNERPISGEFIALHQILGFVQKGLEKHGSDQKLQFAGRQITPEIPISKNPFYSLVSKDFTEEVKKKCFELAGYYILSMPEDEDYPNLFTAKRQSGFEKSKTLVLCLDNARLNLSNTHIEQFILDVAYKREEREIDRGIIVTRNDIPEDLQRKVESSGIGQWETYNSLMQNLIDFEDYRNKLIRDFEESDPDNPDDPPLAKYYVDLKAERTTEIGNEAVPIDSYIRSWLSQENREQLIILGEYGTGKSSLCKKLSCSFSKEYKIGARIPILFNLRDCTKGFGIESLVTHHLDEHGVQNPKYKTFKAMNDKGLFLLIFDGFDEMAIQVDRGILENNLKQIEKLSVSPKAKAIITSRPEHFISQEEEIKILQSPDPLLSRKRRYERITLCKFNPEQIETFLKKRVPLIKEATKSWQYYQSQIEKIHNLKELSQRPVLLEMIVKTLPDLVKTNRPVNRPNLYQTYLELELKRKEIQILIEPNRRLLLIQNLAVDFYRRLAEDTSKRESPGIYFTDARIIIEKEMKVPEDEVESYTREFLTCSFLIRKKDSYHFSHQSFWEYLVAKALKEEIDKDILPDSIDEKDQIKAKYLVFGLIPLVSFPAIRDFLVEFCPNKDTLYRWIETTGKKFYKAILEKNLKYVGGNAFTLLNIMEETLGRQEAIFNTDLKIDEFEKELNEKKISQQLRDAFRNLSKNRYVLSDNPKIKKISGTEWNIDEYLIKKETYEKKGRDKLTIYLKRLTIYLKRKDFLEADLEKADLSGADLTDANFKGANLRRVNLTNAILRNADFSEAYMTGAEIGEERSAYSVVSLTQNGEYIASGHRDGTINIWERNKGKWVKRLKGHTSRITGICFSANGEYLVSGDLDGLIKIWEIATGKNSGVLYAWRVLDVCCDLKERYFVSTHGDGIINVWKWGPERIETLQVLSLEVPGVTLSIALHPDGRFIASGHEDGRIELWDLTKLKELKRFNLNSAVRSLAWHPQGKYLIGGTQDGLVKIWAVGTDEKEIAKFEDPKNPVLSLCCTPDGEYIIIGYENGVIRIWNLKGKAITKFEAHKGSVCGICCSKDGEFISSVSENEGVFVWKLKEEKLQLLTVVEQAQDCQGMRIAGVRGLEKDQIEFLISRGAIQ